MKRLLQTTVIMLLVASAAADEMPCATTQIANAAIPGADRVVKLLSCPAPDSSAESIVAVYASSGSDTPTCFGRVELMDQSGNYFLGKVKSLEARTLPDNSIIVVPSLAGGEANHFWTSQAFLRLDEKCGVTQLAKLYSRMHYDEDDGSKCEGAKHTYKFIEGGTVELRREKIHCEPTSEVVTVETKTFDLDAMLRDPKLRILEP